MFADGTNEVFWQFFSHIFVATDAATPNGLAIFRLSCWLRLGFDVGLVIVVCGRRCVGECFHLGDKPDEQHVCAEVNGLFHISRDECVGATCDGEGAIADTATICKVGELVHGASTLETKMLEEFKVGSFAKDGSCKAS